MIQRVVLSYPETVSDWGRRQIDTDRYRGWLRRSHETFTEGERFGEFYDTGCCTVNSDLEFVVEHVDGDGSVTAETTIELVTRAVV